MPNSSKSKNIHRWCQISLRLFLLITFSVGTLLGLYGPQMWDLLRDLTAAKSTPAAKPTPAATVQQSFTGPVFDIKQDWNSDQIEAGMKVEELEMRRLLPTDA